VTYESLEEISWSLVLTWNFVPVILVKITCVDRIRTGAVSILIAIASQFIQPYIAFISCNASNNVFHFGK